MKLGWLPTAIALAACGDSTAPRLVESVLVASGRVLYPAGAPAREALVGIDAMSKGKPGGDYGCTGAYLVGNWFAFTDAGGRFTLLTVASAFNAYLLVYLALHRYFGIQR